MFFTAIQTQKPIDRAGVTAAVNVSALKKVLGEVFVRKVHILTTFEHLHRKKLQGDHPQNSIN